MSGARPAASLGLLGLLLAPELAGVSEPIPAEPARIVAIGDVHGAAGALRILLRTVGLVDEDDRWSGGSAVLVQTGDFLDRGDSALAVAGWLRELQVQARAAGGRVHVLMGNHEALNLLGDYSDVTSALLRPLVDAESEERRRELCRHEVPIRKARARAAGEDVPSTNLAFNRCVADNPLGLVEYVERISPDEPLGQWLRELPAALVLGDTLFTHGGISPELAERTPEEIDRRLREEIEQLDEARAWLRETGRATLTVRMKDAVATARRLVRDSGEGDEPVPEAVRRLADFQDWLLVRPGGPLWYRGWTALPGEAPAAGEPPEATREGAASEELRRVLEARGVRRMVVGHTPQRGGRIASRFGGRLLAIDTGMLTAVYRGAPAALEIRGDRVEAIYLDGRVPLESPREPVSPAPAPAPRPR